ncbi:acetoin utilization protein AcuC [Quadrisphaera sp. INWT6]|uniref:acetoin utilization protein AcuC n=1 Tax=Quadrisphaera sp. INWT6 TaxID=2596917 RepID=UPI0028152103|nr:acetoin utilization protein AcuC [Quadrisphaera sp. INWT6]
MTGGAFVVWDDALSAHDFGPGHPMAPLRLDLTARLARDLGLLSAPGVRVVGSRVAPDELLLTAHDPAYVAAVRRVSADPRRVDLAHGLGTDDDPVFAGMHETSARFAAASTDCAEAVWSGEAEHAVNVSGGMHHAMPDRAAGFCIYNDLVVAIRHLLARGAQRVVYIDLDVHHGDGVEVAFWDDPRVMTISLHESGRTLFPGTGWPEETGGPGAEGSAVNVALPAGTADAGWLRALHAVAHPLVRSFRPDVIVTQHGADAHAQDPLANLSVSVDAQRAAARSLHELAHEVCGGRWVATGGGGYDVVDVVPRVWSHLLGIAAHAPVPPATPVPASWREHVEAQGWDAPLSMTDGADAWYTPWEAGADPSDPLDRAVLATRRAVFPNHGLDPWFD